MCQRNFVKAFNWTAKIQKYDFAMEVVNSTTDGLMCIKLHQNMKDNGYVL
jgi:hypothetical protein